MKTAHRHSRNVGKQTFQLPNIIVSETQQAISTLADQRMAYQQKLGQIRSCAPTPEGNCGTTQFLYGLRDTVAPGYQQLNLQDRKVYWDDIFYQGLPTLLNLGCGLLRLRTAAGAGVANTWTPLRARRDAGSRQRRDEPVPSDSFDYLNRLSKQEATIKPHRET